MRAFTDYPILQLGDRYAEPAQTREVEVLGYDKDKYCLVRVSHLNVEIKRGYLHKTPELNCPWSHEECTELDGYSL